MGCRVKWKFVIEAVFILVLTSSVDGYHPHDSVPSARFSHAHNVPTKVISRTKREIGSGLHANHVEVNLDLGGQPHVLDLVLNRQLLSKDVFLRVEHSNGTKIHRFGAEGEELCQYQGKVRGVPTSRVAVSLCEGVRGVAVMDPHRTFYLEPGSTSNETLVYDSRHLLHSNNHSCGFPDTHQFHHNHRVRREAEMIKGPYNENEDSRYVELVLVVDNEVYKDKDNDLQKVYRHCKDITNIINSLFVPLNIFVALVGVVVWTEENQIKLSTNGDNTLTQFLHYRRERLVKDHPNDNAQLLTKTKFEGGVVGKALKGPICTYEFSGGVSTDHSTVLGLVATTVAHEMGHNFGMEHDNAECNCPDEKCIMAPSSSNVSPSHWSSCSLDYLALAFEHGMDYCLRNKPKQLFDSPTCGNGFVEAGEQCDCGLPDSCNNACCNPHTCMLHPNATCATGRCCNLQTCQPKTAGQQCRRAERECDLPEFCTGESEFCPADVYKMDGETCRKGKAYCYTGKCRTHADQCKLLWGDSGSNSDDECYGKNTMGSRHGNCGFNRLNQSYVKCNDFHVQCGMLHCKHQNERLEFGMESVSILAHSFINKAGSIVPCRTAMVDLGINEVDPGLAPDGAKCGEDMMCVNQKCMLVGALRAKNGNQCPEDCNGNGACNNKGHCHCNKGYAPPTCTMPGIGGSEDSGPISDPNAIRGYTTALYVVFLGIIPLLAAASCGFLYWKRDPRVYRHHKPASHSSNALLEGSGGKRTKDGHPCDPSALSATTLMGDGQPVSITPLQKELIGQFKGFSIKPMEKEEDQYQATNLLLNNSRQVAGVKSPTLRTQNKWNNTAATAVRPPAAPNVSFKSPKPKQRYANEDHKVEMPSIDVPDGPRRVEISQPVLEGTTNGAAKDLIDGTLLQPVRPAPAAPAAQPCTVPEEMAPAPPPSSHEREFPTLTKIANIMRNASIKRVNEKIQRPKIDREKLRGLEISNPIPQVEEEQNEPKSPTSSMIQRAQSMREATPPRQPITSFGSMRGKRPISVHVPASRPSAPPPRPPPQPPAPPPKDYSYDDCLNLIVEKQAPLAHIDDDDASLKRADNIYAVIEESPPNKSDKSVRFLDDKYEVPKAPDVAAIPPLKPGNPLSTSTESMGLLGEIVNEIQTRNNDSIYSAGTLKRKKKEAEEKRLKDAGRYENATAVEVYQPSDVSSTSSSNGYLSPKNINLPTVETIPAPVATQAPESKPEPDKLKDIDISSYKPYTSSLIRNSGPLSMAYSKKLSTPTANSSFTKPSLLGTPTTSKLTPHSITSSFKSPKSASLIGESSTDSKKSSTSTFKPQGTAASEPETIPPKLPTIIKPEVKPETQAGKTAPKVAPRPKDSKIQRPLPSIPKKPSETGAPNKPLPSVPSSDSLSKSALKRPSDVNRANGKPTPPSAASKPKLNS